MTLRKTGIAILAAATVAVTAEAGAAITGGTPQKAAPLDERSAVTTTTATTPAWLRSLVIRSEALNDQYEWLRVIMIRSEELNDEYAWLRALILRSEELIRAFGFGEYETAP